jgi:hypothetical protein
MSAPGVFLSKLSAVTQLVTVGANHVTLGSLGLNFGPSQTGQLIPQRKKLGTIVAVMEMEHCSIRSIIGNSTPALTPATKLID